MVQCFEIFGSIRKHCISQFMPEKLTYNKYFQRTETKVYPFKRTALEDIALTSRESRYFTKHNWSLSHQNHIFLWVQIYANPCCNSHPHTIYHM